MGKEWADLQAKVSHLEAELKRLREHPELTDEQLDAIKAIPLCSCGQAAMTREAIRKAVEDSNG